MQFLSTIAFLTTVISVANGVALPQPGLHIAINIQVCSLSQIPPSLIIHSLLTSKTRTLTLSQDPGHSKQPTASDLFKDDGDVKITCLGEWGMCHNLSSLLQIESRH